MTSFKVPDEFKPLINSAEEWGKWRKRFLIYYGAANMSSKSENQQRDILLHIMGDAGLEIYETLGQVEPEQGKVLAILDAITNHYKPYRNTTYKRHAFATAMQKETETIDQFVTDLSHKAKECEFGTLAESLIRDRLICGIRDGELRERLLREGDLPLHRAIDMCRAHEISRSQSQALNINSESLVHATQSYQGRAKSYKSRNARTKAVEESNKCTKCLREHGINSCPAYRKKCNNCGKHNHFAIACRAPRKDRERRQINMMQAQQDEETDSYFMGALTNLPIREENDWLELIKVGGNQCLFKLDTGSHVNILPTYIYNKLRIKPTLRKPKNHITSYTDHKLKSQGSCNIECYTQKGTKGVYDFEIVETRFRPILGARACEELRLVKRMYAITDTPTTMDLLSEFEEVFVGLGRVPGYHRIRLNPGIKPSVSGPRRIPAMLQDKVKNELKSMESRGIIEKIESPTEWVHPMVLVSKPEGGLRICLDPRQLNLAIQRAHLQMPTQEALLAQLNGARYFTVLDAASAFHQIVLDRKSSEICTFATPFGRYRFTRLPFGLKSAPEVFQGVINKIMQDLPGTVCYCDDVLVYGGTQEEHDQRLREVLERARRNNLKFDRTKVQLSQPSVRYLGNILSAEGIQILPSRVTAINNLRAPKDKKELQRFLGMINYLSKFLPQVADKTQYLRQLLKKNCQWEWDKTANDDFEHLKAVVTQAPTLAYFDPQKIVTLAADASQYGLGATMMQEGKPIAYASATLTPTQRGYAQIDKELLAIVYACERFHYYIYGRECIVETDHKPLVNIALKPLERLSPRIQRMIVRLQRYQTNIRYVPGKLQFIADTLSRDPEPENIDTNYLDNEAGAVHLLVNVTPRRLAEITEATKKDKHLSRITTYCKEGWPQKRHTVPEEVQVYWPYREELHVQQELVFRGQRIVIPSSERKEILKRLHESHLGIVACKDRARQIVYWPNITKDIEEYVSGCVVCNLHPRAYAKEPLLPHPVPTRPWEKIGVDFMELGGREYILAIDYYSKYIEMQLLGRTTAGPVISFMKAICARHGKPSVVVSDNGPPFDSQSFKKFASDWEIQHVTSSPWYARSNGMVERAVQTLKGRLKKSLQDGTDPYTVLLNYRATPHAGLASPGELLMGRKLATFVPIAEELLQPNYDTTQTRQQLQMNQDRQKEYADRGTKPLRPLTEGERVIYAHKPEEWKEGMIGAAADHPRSYQVITQGGQTLRRNRLHIRPVPETRNSNETSQEGDVITHPKKGMEPAQQTEELDTIKPSLEITPKRLSVKPPTMEMNQPATGEAVDTATASEERITRSGRVVRTPARFKKD